MWPDKLRFLVTCSDGSELEPETLEDLLSLPNTASRSINRILIRSVPSGSLLVRIEFSSGEYGKVEYTIEGEDAEVMVIAGRVDERLEAMVDTPYSRVSSSGGRMLVGVTVGLFALAVLPLLLLSNSYRNRFGPTIVLGAFVLFFMGLFATPTVLANLFPAVVFAIGQGSDRYQRLVGRRKLIGAGICLALLVGILASVIANKVF